MSRCFRMGVPASGDGVPGDLPVPSVDAVEAAPAHPHIPDCPVGLPVADLQDHAGSSKWSSSAWCWGITGALLTCAASGRGEAVSFLPRRPLSSCRPGLASCALFCPFRGLCLNAGDRLAFPGHVHDPCFWDRTTPLSLFQEETERGALDALLPPPALLCFPECPKYFRARF